MRKISVLFVLLALSGCSGAQLRHQNRLASIEKSAAREMLIWECSRAPEYDGIPCPEPIFKEMEREGNLVESRYKTTAEKKSAYAKFPEMFNARLSLRYKYANWDEIATTCKAYPDVCDSFESVEKQALTSHNEVVVQTAHETAANSRERMYREDSASSSNFANAAAIWGGAIQNARANQQPAPQIPTRTNCTTTPNYMGGYSTTCN